MTADSSETATTCERCGAESPPAARFCPVCGNRLGAPPDEERKLVSVLFVDLAGFTASSDQADPEDVRDLLEGYHAVAKECIEQYGGVLEKFIGDAVMAVFGAPVSYGDDAERAVRAGLRTLEETGRLGLSARAAVETGEAVVRIADPARGDAIAMGDVVNTASRLQSSAPPGRLVVGELTWRATRNAFEYAELPPVDAKGKAAPVPAWEVVAPAVAPSDRPFVRRPLVGRERELHVLRTVWERAVAERRPSLVTLVGPPGIGKSRLCLEASELVEASGGRILRGRCLPYEGQTGYQAFPAVVREAAGIFESDAIPVAHEKLAALIADVASDEEAGDATRHLGLLLGVLPDSPVEEERLLFFAARRLLECLATRQPLLVVVEDIHWAQPSELELLEYLAIYLRDSPVVLLALARPELHDARPSWGAGLVSQTTVPLEPLDDDLAAQLAAQLVRSVGAGSADVERLVEVAEGNPLFIEELVAATAELGDDNELPVTVRAAIAARIDALPEDSRAVLLACAVIGKTFWRGPLQRMTSVPDLDAALDGLEARDLVRREPTSQLAGDLQFRFKHMLIRDVAYSTVPRAIRRQRHADVAQHIEETMEDAVETLAWVLAHHWGEAGEPRKAIPYLLVAAELAQRGWAKDAAVGLYERALELSEDDAERRRIRLLFGLALVLLEDFEHAAEELGALLPELEGADRLEALLGRGRATHWSEDHVETIAMGEQAVALAEELGDREALPAALALLSQALQMRGDDGDIDRALELGEKALATWVPGARPVDHSQALDLFHDTTYWTGQYEWSARLSAEARAVAADVHGAEILLRGGGGEALALAGLGRHEEALAIWEELFAIAADLGRNPRVLLNYSSLVFREVHDLEEARRRSEEALERSGDMVFSMPRSFARSDLIFTDLLAGDVGGAQTAWKSSWEDAEHATAWTRWLIYGRLAAARAEIALRAETPESALEWSQRAIDIAVSTRRRKYEAQARISRGHAMTALGRREDAFAEFESAVRIADDLVGAPARFNARAELARAAYALGDDERAAAAAGEARVLVADFAATLAPERARALLGSPLAQEVLGA